MTTRRKLLCPKHDVALTGRQTRYGYRWNCPIDSCTVACWNGGTSTPADDETRAARMRAHAAFDPLWQRGPFKRSKLYAELAETLGLSKGKTHIGMFDIETCEKVVKFAREITA